MAGNSKAAVVTAIAANSIVTVIKFGASLVSGSAAMMNEAVHSLMDTLNQCFLLIGITVAARPADKSRAFGHSQKKYLWNLWSAIGLFSIGAGLGMAHAWHAWHERATHTTAENVTLMGFTINPLILMLVVLAVAFVLEGYAFKVAYSMYAKEMRNDGHTNPFKYIKHAHDPTLLAVVLEDSVAMIGLAMAAFGIIMTAITGHVEWDIVLSAMIALLLGVVAFYLGYLNMRFLSGLRDTVAEEVFADVIRNHPEITRFHDLRSIIFDEANTVIVAEIELKEEAIAPGIGDKIDKKRDELLSSLAPESRDDQATRERAEDYAAVQTTLEKTEEIIDAIEQELKTRLPRISHITLEVEGIAPFVQTEPAPTPSPNAGQG